MSLEGGMTLVGEQKVSRSIPIVMLMLLATVTREKRRRQGFIQGNDDTP